QELKDGRWRALGSALRKVEHRGAQERGDHEAGWVRERLSTQAVEEYNHDQEVEQEDDKEQQGRGYFIQRPPDPAYVASPSLRSEEIPPGSEDRPNDGTVFL